MCDFSEKLVAWMDHELADPEATEVAQHVDACAECQKCFTAYKDVDKAFKAYCDAASHEEKRRRVPVWVPVVSLAAAAAVLFFLFPRSPVQRESAALPAVSSSAVVEAPPAPVRTPVRPPKKPQRPHGLAAAKSYTVNWVPAVPTIEIAIPAEAMLAPGAIPAGVTLTAEVSIAADGSAQQVRLQP